MVIIIPPCGKILKQRRLRNQTHSRLNYEKVRFNLKTTRQTMLLFSNSGRGTIRWRTIKIKHALRNLQAEVIPFSVIGHNYAVHCMTAATVTCCANMYLRKVRLKRLNGGYRLCPAYSLFSSQWLIRLVEPDNLITVRACAIQDSGIRAITGPGCPPLSRRFSGNGCLGLSRFSLYYKLASRRR